MTIEREIINNLIKKPATSKFPYEKTKITDGIRTQVVWDIEKCIGCQLCEKICPSEAIKLLGKGRASEIEYNISHCIFCGECIDICPTKAIETSKEIKLVSTKIDDMIIRFERKK